MKRSKGRPKARNGRMLFRERTAHKYNWRDHLAVEMHIVLGYTKLQSVTHAFLLADLKESTRYSYASRYFAHERIRELMSYYIDYASSDYKMPKEN